MRATKAITTCETPSAAPGPKRKRNEEEVVRMPILALTFAAALLAAVPARAHHAFAAEFDINQPIKLQGTVSRMEWVNPHAWIHVDVAGPDGKVTSWMV